jgi:hypothetical protein
MLILLAAALGLADSAPFETQAGLYTEVGEPQACAIELTSRGAFVLSCPDQKEIAGQVSEWGEALAFGVSPDALGADPEYWKARQKFATEHLREHASYPLVFPPRLPTVPLPLVPVAGPQAQFLVEPSERASFCRGLRSGSEPGAAARRNAVFRKAGGSATAGTPWRVFCEAGREPNIVMPGLGR